MPPRIVPQFGGAQPNVKRNTLAGKGVVGSGGGKTGSGGKGLGIGGGKRHR